MHPQILIELLDHVSKHLAFLLIKTRIWLYTLRLESSVISPICKSGARNKAENYRSISLTSIVCKLMESFVKESVMIHMGTEIFCQLNSMVL